MKNKISKSTKIISFVLIAVFVVSIITSGTFKDNSSVLDEVRSIFKYYYVDEVPDSTLNLPTVDDIMKQINKTDIHTNYFTEAQYSDFTNSINNTFSGIGVSIEIVPQGVQILTVFDGSPAQEKNIKPGDIITMADTHNLAGLDSNVALGYIKGPEGTSVKLKIKRGSEYYTIDITRRKINAPTVAGKILDNHIGYIDISSFGQDTAALFGKTLKEDEAKKVDSYIVDLRNNGGGYLTTALDIAGYFIGDKLALITRGRINGETRDKAVAHDIKIDKPVIFLINEYSASASEILSGVVRDYNKAYFIGVRSYGKGSVQQPFPLSNKDVLKMTIDKFYSPKGITIDKVGITPNLVVPDTIDSARVAQLVLDTPSKLPANNRGYFKITTAKKTVIAKQSRAVSPEFWNAYKQLINLANKSGQVMFGTGKGWISADKNDFIDIAKLYYPKYSIKQKEFGITTDSAIKVNFDSKVLKSSVNKTNIELIDSSTGERSDISFKSVGDKSAVVAPEKKFVMNKLYYLVVGSNVKKADKTSIGNGFIYELNTKKK